MRQPEGRKRFAKKSLGQNFLSDPNFIRKIVASLGVSEGDRVFEIGPGRGALTEALIESGADVLAVELDRDLVPILRSQFSSTGKFEVIEGDALEIDFTKLAKDGRVKLAANLPYYISTAILQRLAAQRSAFSELVVMLQKEVVERIAAEPGSKERGYLSVIIQENFSTQKLFDVPPRAFRPAPKVWSAVIRLVPKEGSQAGDAELFEKVVSAGFAQRRKTILNNLKASRLLDDDTQAAKALAESGIEPTRRAETLTLEEWHALAASVASASR